MSAFAVLIPVAVAALIGSYLSYTNGHWGLVVASGFVTAILWAVAVKYAKTPEELFVVSCVWDVILILAYTALPFLAGLIELSLGQCVGLGLLGMGLVLVKMG